MKRGFLVTVVMISFCVLNAQSKVVADITNIRNNKGVCRACIFNNAASFNGETGKPYACVIVPVKNKTASAAFTNVAPGAYALMVFHDANNNNKMDKNFLGIPSEGYGASQNKLPFAAAPNFNDNKFTVANASIVSLRIKMRNL
ncbi:MAG: hypothetical protein JWQ96_2384 [Segetibacter sp.]|jgi:uncharacterized protein (DUF2141 family)|nr:hypothetical protein [Segetibacter sp.]